MSGMRSCAHLYVQALPIVAASHDWQKENVPCWSEQASLLMQIFASPASAAAERARRGAITSITIFMTPSAAQAELAHREWDP